VKGEVNGEEEGEEEVGREWSRAILRAQETALTPESEGKMMNSRSMSMEEGM
jgi:hypothetical protein